MLAAELTGIDDAVFLTGGSQAALGGWATLMSLVNVGRDVDCLLTTVGWLLTAEGKFVGWLEFVLTMRSRVWENAVVGLQTIASNAQVDRRKIFFKTFKLYNSELDFREGNQREVNNNSPINKRLVTNEHFLKFKEFRFYNQINCDPGFALKLAKTIMPDRAAECKRWKE